MKRNFKFTLSYDGSRYQGWQHQPKTDMTIQGKLESVLSRLCDSPVQVIGAGRTDAGVHARAMTANAFLETDLSAPKLQAYMNRYLPDDISINDIRECGDRFHSRYKALGKTYRYTLWYGDSKPVFDRKYVTVLEEKPDLEAMKTAASLLEGKHDFAAFCRNPSHEKSTVRLLDRIQIESSGNYIRIYYHGNGFLRNMVRIMTGTLLEVGFHRMEAHEIPLLLEGCKKGQSQAGPTAPPQGLTLMKVDY